MPHVFFHALSCRACQVTLLHHSTYPVTMERVMERCANCGAAAWEDLGVVQLERVGRVTERGVVEPINPLVEGREPPPEAA